ncbi:hypothetical protein AZH53_07975 [Methanomicrobiaceae archaeon CYW5]|uniref:flavodoxin family protein n=1 Tax=Methanovulcanius yangii TaxID=1789227 RepID=UPI0029CA3E7F|nr:flavodoxin family protein [Methanovulcanius yangii]MBT8508341.1 hypothetical protein [Methanovulcanius yangii]
MKLPLPSPLRSRIVSTSRGEVTVRILHQDVSSLYPGMERYFVEAVLGEEVIASFRTNSYEYSPGVALTAEQAAFSHADDWEAHLAGDVAGFVEYHTPRHHYPAPDAPVTDVVVIQGSPRPDGNCAAIAGWVAEVVKERGLSVQVLYLDDLILHPCIGCYRCFNDGVCTFEDDMDPVYEALEHALLLAVVSPVYTNTVPAGLKAVMDRCQALHARRTITGTRPPDKGRSGLFFSVAGRVGTENFAAILPVATAFFSLVAYPLAATPCFDGMDHVPGIGAVDGARERVEGAVAASLDAILARDEVDGIPEEEA